MDILFNNLKDISFLPLFITGPIFFIWISVILSLYLRRVRDRQRYLNDCKARSASQDTVTWSQVYGILNEHNLQIENLLGLSFQQQQRENQSIIDVTLSEKIKQQDLQLEQVCREYEVYKMVQQEKYENTLQARQDLMVSLESQVITLEQENDALRAENEMRERKLTKFKQKLAASQQHNLLLQAEKTGRDREFAILRQELAMSRLEINQLRVDRTPQGRPRRGMVEVGRNQILYAIAMFHDLQDCNYVLTRQLEAQEAEAQEAEAKQTVFLRRTIENLERDYLVLHEKLVAAEDTVDNRNREKQLLEKQISSLQQDKYEIKGTLQKMKQDYHGIEQQLKRLHDKQAEDQHRLQEIEALENEKNELQELLVVEKQKTERLELVVRDTSNELQHISEVAIGYQQQMDELKTEMKQLQDQCTDKEQQIAALNDNLTEKESKFAQMQQKEEELLKEMDHFNQKLETDHELKVILNQIQHQSPALNQLMNDKKTVLPELENLQADASQATLDLEQLEAKKQRAVNKLEELERTITAKQKVADHLENHVDDVYDTRATDQHNNTTRKQRYRRENSKIRPLVTRSAPLGNLSSLKSSRSTSTPRLMNSKLSLTRSKSTRLTGSKSADFSTHLAGSKGICINTTMGRNELYQSVRRMEAVITDLQRQLGGSHLQLEDCERRLAHWINKCK